MAAGATDYSSDFSLWLNEILQKLNTDESVFGFYIEGILESDDTNDEKIEALHGILSEIIENKEQLIKVCNQVLEKWECCKSKQPQSKEVLNSDDVNIKLVKLLESRSLSTAKQKIYTAEEKKIRDAILQQYSQMTDDEEEINGDPNEADCKKNSIEKNTNVQTALKAEKVKREQAKLDSLRKKEKDKEDREKQKQVREEKKEKRKTQKCERRR